MVIGLDGSRNRSGGARAYLIGIMNGLRAPELGVEHVHLWAPRELLAEVTDQPWLSKHSSSALEKSLPWQLLWQAFVLATEARRLKCDLLFTTDASTVSRFQPMATFSQDLLAYEPEALASLGWGRERLRLVVIRWLQNSAFRRSAGVIFLTEHAARVIQSSCGALKRYAVIPHGVGEEFRMDVHPARWPMASDQPVQVLYVSSAAMYKHQWVVVRAIATLRRRGYAVKLTLIGGGNGQARALLDQAIFAVDPQGEFVRQLSFMPHRGLPEHLANADLFVFASSCEAFGITLLEAMAAGLPIACSDRSSLPETLRDGGVYFDPEDERSIAAAIERLLLDGDLRHVVSTRARQYASSYSWERCAAATWQFVVDIARREISQAPKG